MEGEKVVGGQKHGGLWVVYQPNTFRVYDRKQHASYTACLPLNRTVVY